MAPWREQGSIEAERAGAVALGVIGSFGSLLGTHGPEMVVWILAAMGLDLFSGLLRALILPNEDVDGGIFATGVLKKMAMLLLLFPAAMLDRMLHLSDMIAPGAGPTAYATMVGLLMYEGASIVRNVQKAIGRTAVTLALIEAIDRFRSLPGEKPERRHYDSEPDAINPPEEP